MLPSLIIEDSFFVALTSNLLRDSHAALVGIVHCD